MIVPIYELLKVFCVLNLLIQKDLVLLKLRRIILMILLHVMIMLTKLFCELPVTFSERCRPN